MPRRKSQPPSDQSLPPQSQPGPTGVTKKRQTAQNKDRTKRSYNFQKLKDKVNRENRKFITSSQEPRKMSMQSEKNVLGTKYQRLKKSLDMNVEKLGSVESMALKIKSELENSGNGNGNVNSNGNLNINVQELLLVFERLISVSSDTRDKVKTMDEYLRQCMEQVEQVNKDFESMKNEHIAFIQGLIRFIDVDWREERQFD